MNSWMITSPNTLKKAPHGLPSLPLDDSGVALRARRTMDHLIAKQHYSKQVKSEPVLPPLSAENMLYLAKTRHEVPKKSLSAIPDSLRTGLEIIGNVLKSFSADELDQLLLECAEDEREVLLASLVARLRSKI